MKKQIKLISLFLTIIIINIAILPNITTVYAAESTTYQEDTLSNKDYLRFSYEVKTIYTELIQYDQVNNKFYVNEEKTEQYYNYDEESIKGVYLMKDNLNDEIINNPGSLNYSEIVQQKISEMEYVLQGNDIDALIPNTTRVKRADFSWIKKCIQEAWGVAVSFVTLKGIVNLVKAGKFEAAAAKLAATTAGKIVGVAALFAFLATCGAETVS